MTISVGIIGYISYYQIEYLKSLKEVSAENEEVIELLSYLISGSIFIMIELMKSLGPVLSVLEKQVSVSNQIISIALKLTLTQFFYTSLINLIVTTFVSQNFYFRGGFIYTQSILFRQAMILNPILNFLNPGAILRKFSQKKIIQNYQLNKCYLTQA
jgi:hypothetical protein